MLQQGNTLDLENLCGNDRLVKIFCDLVSFDTKSDPLSKNVPSSVGQLRLGASLVSEIRTLGFECTQDKNGVVITKVPASSGYENAIRICLLAHLDTAPDASGKDVLPHLVKDYKGEGIELKNGLIIDDKLCKELKNHIGEDIIVTDGTTLLGADDKAGVAVLLNLLYKLKTTDIPHGALTIVFTVDEEIGYSADYVDLDVVDCDYGVTIDGSECGEFDVETFNASLAKVEFTGISVHTAVAYKKLVNAVTLACEFNMMLPLNERPENTRDHEGFYHLHDINGSTEYAVAWINLRDFEKDGLKKREEVVLNCAKLINQKLGYDAVKVTIKEQYVNLMSYLQENRLILDLCKEAFADANVEVKEHSVRGGTDGSNLSARGLPTPNIFTGALNCHGPYECLPVQSLHKAYDIVECIVKRAANKLR